MVPSARKAALRMGPYWMHRRALRARLLSFRLLDGLCLDEFLHATIGSVRDKVMAPEIPANPAALVTS
jgi:hypothetical protein